MNNKHIEKNIEEVNPNGSLLSPDAITFCNNCQESHEGSLRACPTCKGKNIDVIKEDE